MAWWRVMSGATAAAAVVVVVILALAAAGVRAAPTTLAVGVFYNATQLGTNLTFPATQAAFGEQLERLQSVEGHLVLASPVDACTPAVRPSNNSVTGLGVTTPWVALVARGNCDFQTKVVNAQNAGASYVLVYNIYPGADLLVMGGNLGGSGGVAIGAAFISLESYQTALPVLAAGGGAAYVRIFNTGSGANTTPWSAILFVSMLAFLISSFFILLFLTLDYLRQRRRRGVHRALHMDTPIPDEVRTAPGTALCLSTT
jgi:hypothetical protein